MVKAKLVESQRYYQLRRKNLLLMLLLSVTLGVLIGLYKKLGWLEISILVLYAAAFIALFKNQRRLAGRLGNKFIEMDEQELRLMSKKGNLQEVIQLQKAEKITVKDEYSLPQQTAKEIGQEMAGSVKQNFLILQSPNEARRFDFEIESYFMANQLNKLVNSWATRGFNIERIS